jgi:N-acetylglucosamine repressor
VGIGIISSGRLFYGSHSYAGEIGHTTIQYDGLQCACGNRGCIETLVTDQAVVERVKKLPGAAGGSREMTIADVVSLAKDESNRSIYEILRETAYFFSITLDHVVKIYDPSIIILQNHWIQEFPELYYDMLENLFTRCPWARQDALKVIVDADERYGEGAAAFIVLDRLMNEPEDNPLIESLRIPNGL